MGIDDDLTPTGVLAAQIIGTLGAGTLGALIDPALGPAGAVVGQAAMTAAAERVVAMRRAHVDRMMGYSADQAEKSVEKMIEVLLDRDELLVLLGMAMEAATRALGEEQLRVIGASLATGAFAEDDAQLSIEFQIMRAIDAIKAPHVHVLAYLWPRELREAGGFYTGHKNVTLEELTGEVRVPYETGLPHLAEGMTGLLGVLQAHGLVVVDLGAAGDRAPSEFSPPTFKRPGMRYSASQLGRLVLERYEAAGF